MYKSYFSYSNFP